MSVCVSISFIGATCMGRLPTSTHFDSGLIGLAGVDFRTNHSLGVTLKTYWANKNRNTPHPMAKKCVSRCQQSRKCCLGKLT